MPNEPRAAKPMPAELAKLFEGAEIEGTDLNALFEGADIEPLDKGAVASRPEVAKPDDPSFLQKLGKAYTTYVGAPGREIAERAVSTRLMPGMPKALQDFVVGMWPETPTGAAITAATLLAPETRAAAYVGSQARNAAWFGKMAKRMLYPVAGGAIGGAAEEEQSALAGAAAGTVAGLATGVGGETISGLTNWFQRSKLAQRLAREDPLTIGTTIRRLVPQFPKMTTPIEWDAAIWGNVAQEKLSAGYRRSLASISKALKPKAGQQLPGPKLGPTGSAVMPSGTFSSPNIARLQQEGIIGPNADFDSIQSYIRQLRFEGKTWGGKPTAAPESPQSLLRYADELSQDVYEALKQFSPKIARSYKAIDSRYSRGAEMLRYLRQPGIINENGIVNTKLLQETFKTEQRIGLTQRFRPKELQELSDALFRGGPSTVTDVLSRASGGGARASIGVARPRIAFDIMEWLRGDQFAGEASRLLPQYISPKKTQLLVGRTGAGALSALSPNSLRKRDESSK
jgi:hypothetical protein